MSRLRRPISCDAVIVSYDAIAPGYDEFVGVSLIHRVAIPSMLRLCAEGDAVLDVACGQGALTRKLARRFPVVVGVDRSPRLIEIARERVGTLQVRYLTEDAEALSSLPAASFDGATCCLALTDFDDLNAVLAATSRVLKRNGWLVIAALHPCFEAPRATNGEHRGTLVKLVSHYFEEGRWWPEDRTRLFGEIGWHHRMLSTILNSFLAAGFGLDCAEEPEAPADVVAENPAYGQVAEVLTLRWRLTSTLRKQTPEIASPITSSGPGPGAVVRAR
jgi:ubiquinone/menaquinone biosynthesis C-methylase UbiE